MSDTDHVNRQGINLLESRVLECGHIFREQAISDFGIDAQIEIKQDDTPTGRLIAVQVKTGPSYLGEEKDSGFWYRPSDEHYNLWINHSLPVIIVLCDLESRTCYYQIVTIENCVTTGKNWKILVPKSQTITSETTDTLADMASPIAAASDFSIVREDDVSHGTARRISLYIVAHAGLKPMSKPHLGAIVRAALNHGRETTYARDDISAAAHYGRTADVVWGNIYLREADINSAGWICRFQWISPELDTRWRPFALSGEDHGNGLIIDWPQNTHIANLSDAARVGKAGYLAKADALLNKLPTMRDALDSLIKAGTPSAKCAEFSRDA
ncbi:DUF4365 domain-containing protein [Pontivivens nitratireducens]|uniref:DUF4365 domain-containing protein n=1 Tax=Pontivivens nitratireducens TaxID=2758038 RepID=A0A6G7VMY5_9RHOB|nr:DUF4365 domain-containing protein [Pontibrevibacter nitratireducens]QIK41409.1 DUF4365 domain-containing protein [Pontibrevibacter nitratireducens]